MSTNKILIVCFGFLFAFGIAIQTTLAEEKEPEFQVELKSWKLAGILSGSLNVTQFEDWQAGGTDMVTITGRGEFWAVRSTDRYDWKNRLRGEYGMNKTNGEDFRTSADLLKLDSRYEQKFNSRMMAYGRGYVETHLADQKVFFDSPTDVLLDSKKLFTGQEKFRVAPGFDPIKLEEGLGIGYTVFKNDDDSSKISVMAGLAGRQLITDSYYKKDDDGDTPEIEYVTVPDDSEFGVEIVMDALITINKHVKFTSFAVMFLGLHDDLWRGRWDNSLDVTLGKYIGLSFTADVIYDESIFDGTQYKTGTLITLSYRVF